MGGCFISLPAPKKAAKDNNVPTDERGRGSEPALCGICRKRGAAPWPQRRENSFLRAVTSAKGWQPHSTGGNQRLVALPPAPEALYCAASSSQPVRTTPWGQQEQWQQVSIVQPQFGKARAGDRSWCEHTPRSSAFPSGQRTQCLTLEDAASHLRFLREGPTALPRATSSKPRRCFACNTFWMNVADANVHRNCQALQPPGRAGPPAPPPCAAQPSPLRGWEPHHPAATLQRSLVEQSPSPEPLS